MYKKEDLKRQLADLNLLPWDTVLIHSSMKSIGDVEGNADTVLDAICEYFCDGLVVFPTHTWATINSDHYIFDPEKEPSCVGILTNLFMKRPNVYRSLHPTHSVAAFGADAKEFVKGEEFSSTPLPREGCWGKLVDRHAKILFIGCDLTKFTLIHGIEAWANVPDRLADTPTPLKIKMPDGTLRECPMYGHIGSVSDNYGKLEKPLTEKRIAHKGIFGDAECIVADAYKTYQFVTMLLHAQPSLFSDKTPIYSDLYTNRKPLQIAPSLLACDYANIERELATVSNADMIHIDVMDGHFVPNISVGIPVVNSISRATNLTLDVHLMVENPSKFIKQFAEAGADRITVHYETDENLKEMLCAIKESGKKAGVSVCPRTPVELLYPFLDMIDIVLIMTVEPGFGGQTLMQSCLDKARKLRAELRSRDLDVEIEADGGICEENIRDVAESGIGTVVMGTAIFSKTDRSAYIEKCKI